MRGLAVGLPVRESLSELYIWFIERKRYRWRISVRRFKYTRKMDEWCERGKILQGEKKQKNGITRKRNKKNTTSKQTNIDKKK